MSWDYYDVLIEQLLRETMGGDRPRDMTARVLALAKAEDRKHRNWWISAGAALAACIAVAVSLWVFWPQKYPGPVVQDPTDVNNSVEVQRGQPLTSPPDSTETVQTGGYVQMVVGPNTTYTIGGVNFKEVVFLEQGHIDATVTKKRGTFDVVVGPAMVHVTGTKFNVDVATGINEGESQLEKRMRVTVEEGSVEVRGLGGGPKPIAAGDSRTFTISADAIPRPRILEMTENLKPGTTPPPTTTTTTIEIKPPQTLPEGRRGRGTDQQPPPARGTTSRGTLQRPNAINNAPNPADPKFAQLQVIIGPGPFSFEGALRHLGPYYVLQTERGLYLLGTIEQFPKETPPPPQPGAQYYVRVVYGGGKVTRMETIKPTPSTKPASF